MIDLANTPLSTAINDLTTTISTLAAGDKIKITAADPDNCIGCYGGEAYEYGDKRYLHRSWHSWNTLAHLLGCRMLTPRLLPDGIIEITLQKLDIDQTFHSHKGYGTNDIFSRISKHEEPSFLHYYMQALDEVHISQRKRILDLGVNNGDELALIRQLYDTTAEMVGIDMDRSAIEAARSRLPEAILHQHDINKMDELDLGSFDLIISIATLQSPGINTKMTVMNLVQNYLSDDGAIIFALPNSRWIDGELIQGAKAPNYSFSELSLVIKDIHWIKKYLQQHRFRVRIFGREYMFLVATKIGNSSISKK